jgi:hypothetical protein
MRSTDHSLLDVSHDETIPYFFMDYRYAVGQVKKILAEGSESQRIWLIAKIMRDAHYCDVWKFISLRNFLKYHEQIMPRLGRLRGFWQFLFSRWIKYGIILDDDSSDDAPK